MFFKMFFLIPGPKYSLRKVYTILLFSTFATSVAFFGSYLFYRYIKQLQVSRGCVIQTLVQTSPRFLALPNPYIAEVLNLSADQPVPLLDFDLEKAKRKLLDTRLFKTATLKRIKPDALYIEYTVREPVAYLEDHQNTAMDENGIFFPFAPFFSPRMIPEIYLGCPFGQPWKEQMPKDKLEIVSDIFNRIGQKKLRRIDLSKVEAKSAGQRELILVLKNKRILRLHPKKYPQQLFHYFILEDKVLKNRSDLYVVDLRIDDVAYLQKV